MTYHVTKPISEAAFPHCSIIAVYVELPTCLPRRRHRLQAARRRHAHPKLLVHLLIFLIHLLLMSHMLLRAQVLRLLLVNAPVSHQFHHVSIDVSTSSRLADDKGKKKKRAKKNPCNMSTADEELMLEFIRDNPVLWNVKMTDYRRKDKKDKIWDDQAPRMEKQADTLKGWFRSLRDTHTRLDKKKSGDGAPDLTQREKWIISNFVFLKTGHSSPS